MKFRDGERDYRRVGCVFEDDPLQETRADMTAIENWKSVMTELNEKKLKAKELSNSTTKKNIDSSFDSGIQQGYNSDNDEVCSSLCMTLNKLVELSKEQQIYLDLQNSDTNLSDATTTALQSHQNQYPENTLLRNIDRLSIQSSNSETNNLVEEMIMKNSCTSGKATDIPITLLGRHADHSSTSVSGYRHLSHSAQNLNTINSDPNADNAFQSLPVKRSFMKNTVKTKSAIYSPKTNAEITIAIDIGTTFSGFSYTVENAPSSNVHIMKSIKDPTMKKLPSILLLNSRTEFHSFGYDAKDYFLSIEQRASSLSSQWLLFEKFKLQLLNFSEINRECEIKATNGVCVPALTVYTRTLNYFKCLALLEISNALQRPVKKDQIRWVITIPVMWSMKGKLFMQEAAFNAGLCSMESKDRLLIIYEAETIAAWCNIFGWSKIVDYGRSVDSDSDYVMIINCGGGVVDVTVHRANEKYISFVSEVHKSSETLYSSHHVNEEFLQLLILIFGNKFVNALKSEKPASLIDLLYQFEFCKCFLSKSKNNSSSANLFISRYIADFYKKITGKQMSETVINFSHEDVGWNDQGAICINANLLQRLFQPLIQKIIKLIKQILHNRTENKTISRIYFVGGLTKSQIFQETLRDSLEDVVSLIFIQNESELCVLKGAVQKALTDTSKNYKLSHSYAVGVLKQFQDDLHPKEKMVSKDGRKWCCDLLDWLVKKDQILQQGEIILKRYTPTTSYQSCIIINIYIVEHDDSKFVTDNGVHSCGALRLSTIPTGRAKQHEILLQLIYNGNEFIANALDTTTGHCTQTKLDNLSYL